MGKKSILKEVEARINSADDAYIKYILLQSASRLATEDAAKLSN
jgi:hypothetical protein